MRSVPSRRDNLHFGPRYRAIRLSLFAGRHTPWASNAARQTRRRFGGRHPLWGIGVTSEMLLIFRPAAFRERTAESRPGPGPRTSTSTLFIPNSSAEPTAFSAATCAANGVLLRDPRKPEPPAVAQHNTFP